MFIVGLSKCTPIFERSCASKMVFEMCKRAFDGIQPLFKQTPPSSLSLSIRVTFFPKSAARNAAAYPPGPAPTTTTSLVSFCFMLDGYLSFFALLKTFESKTTKAAPAAPSITL